MASTRIFDDRGRIEKRNAIDTFSGRHTLDVPGNGSNMPFNNDPHIRIQKWGANFCSNMMDINSDLRGMSRPLIRDHIQANDYKKHATVPMLNATIKETIDYVTDESRATHPAWTYREVENNRWEPPMINPIDTTFLNKPFYENLNTRILEKDYFKVKYSRSAHYSPQGSSRTSIVNGEPVPYNK